MPSHHHLHHHPPTTKDLGQTLMDLIDGLVEVFLTRVVTAEPLWAWQAQIDRALEDLLRQWVVIHLVSSDQVHDDKDSKEHRAKTTYTTTAIAIRNAISSWIRQRPGNLAYSRLGITLVTVVLLSRGHAVGPAVLVCLMYLLSYLERVMSLLDSPGGHATDLPPRHVPVEEDTFEVVTTGSPHCVSSWARVHRARLQATGFVSDMVDRVAAILGWIALLPGIPQTGRFHFAQYVTLLALVVLQSLHGYLDLYKFWTTTTTTTTHGGHDSNDTIFHESINPLALHKIKKTWEFVGMALFILPITRYLGVFLVILSLPLAYELLRQAGKKRVLYYVETGTSFDHKKLKEWMQLKSLASQLVVGVTRPDAVDMVLNACATSTVDQVVVEAPAKVDLLFIEKQSIDFVVITPGQANVVTDEVIRAEKVLILGEHSQLRRVMPKASEHQE